MPDLADVITYIAGEPAPGTPVPRIGDPVELRRSASGHVVEAFSASGQRLGRLPSSESDILTDALPDHLAWHGSVTALLPRPREIGAGRIHIRVSAG